jgi:glycosidase
LGPPWWHGAVLYQLYVRSWRDTNDDGYGDLRGIIERLDHLSWLGVDGVWLSPTMPSPDADWGYDVSDYTGVHPELGTLADLDELITQAGQRGMRVLLDLVPNHTSSAHPWFIDAASSRTRPTATTTCGPIRARTAGRRTTGSTSPGGPPGSGTRAASTTCTTSWRPSRT